MDYFKKSKIFLSFFLISLLILNVSLSVKCQSNETSTEQKSLWDQLVDGWNNLVKGVADTFTIIKDFLYNSLSKLWDFIQNFAKLLFEAMRSIGEIFTNLFQYIISFIGNWGDPELYIKIKMSMTMYPEALSNSTYVKDFAIVLGQNELLEDNRTIDEITPSGVLGLISFFVFTIKSSTPLITWILQNFVLLHVIVIVLLLVWGMIGSVEKKDADYFIENLERVVGIFKFYAKIITWFAERIIDFGTMVAQWLDTIIPF